MKLTKNQQEFIGTTFNTHRGGVLTVTEVDSGTNVKGKWNNKFILECSICSKDKELWGQGSITGSKADLKGGSIPCGCTFNPKWTEGQNIIRVKRECKGRGYIFHGWVGDYKRVHTKLDLENPVTNHRWKSTSIHNFLYGKGDPTEGREKIRRSSLISDKQHIKEFIEAGFTEDYKFWRSDRLNRQGRKSYWYYTCQHCSNDEYVEDGLCSGIFEAQTASLKQGRKSCRCSDAYRWTQEQREYQINKACKEENLTFIGWDSKYQNTLSKFNWVCSEDHECKTSVSKFLYRGSRCFTCYKAKQKGSGTMYGYYPHRTEEKDHLYTIRFKKDGVIKVGRTFDVNQRLKGNSTSLLKQSKHVITDIEILDILTGTHQEIYNLEQALHEELTELGFHTPLEWTREAFKEDCEEVLTLLLKRSGVKSDRDCYMLKTTLNDLTQDG